MKRTERSKENGGLSRRSESESYIPEMKMSFLVYRFSSVILFPLEMVLKLSCSRKIGGNELWLSSFTFYGNDAVTITIVSTKPRSLLH